ncbi:MAG: type transporter [Thermoleophilia bacterium]|nr:type transporter [Thermoleophilia bacterium]
MSTLVSDSLVMARRNFEHVRRVPEKLLDVTLQPIMFTLLFAFVFGAVIAIPGGSYREYLIPGIIIQTLTFGMMGPGVSMVTDLSEGVVDRLRTLPMAKGAYLIGFIVAEVAATLLGATILTATGLAIGWRAHGDVSTVASGFGIMVLVALTFVTLGGYLGMIAKSSEGVQGIAFMTVFPLTFLASTFVPIGGLSPVLRHIAEWNPITWMAAALRTQFGNPVAPPDHPGLPMQHPVLFATVFCAVLLVVLVPLSIRRFTQRTTD